MLKDFLTSFLIVHLSRIVELLSILLVAYNYHHIKKNILRWTLPFLIFVFCAEVATFACAYFNMYKLNVQFNDVVGIGESVFYSFLFYNFTKNKIFQTGVITSALVCILLYLIGFFFYTTDSNFLVFSVITSGFLITIVSCWYLLVLFMDDSQIGPVYLEPGFWISMGVTLFFAGSSIVFSLHDYIANHDLRFMNERLYRFVPRVLSVVLYSCISIAVILCKKKTKISLQPS